MPDISVALAWQVGVLWVAKGPDRNGQVAVSASPFEVNWRLNKNRAEVIGPDGNVLRVEMSALIGGRLDGTPLIPQRVNVGSVMWLGRIANLPSGGDYFGQLEELLQVKGYVETPDVKARYSTRTVGLMRLRDSYPTMV